MKLYVEAATTLKQAPPVKGIYIISKEHNLLIKGKITHCTYTDTSAVFSYENCHTDSLTGNDLFKEIKDGVAMGIEYKDEAEEKYAMIFKKAVAIDDGGNSVELRLGKEDDTLPPEHD